MIIFSSATEAVKAGMELLSTFGFTEQDLLKMNKEGNSALNGDITSRSQSKSGGFETIENDNA